MTPRKIEYRRFYRSTIQIIKKVKHIHFCCC